MTVLQQVCAASQPCSPTHSRQCLSQTYADTVSEKLVCMMQQANPAVLYNGGNEYLHYEDTWYILSSKPDEYVLVYYVGNNDAWKGYGGGTVYSRCAASLLIWIISTVFCPDVQ